MRPDGRILTRMPFSFRNSGSISEERLVSVMLNCLLRLRGGDNSVPRLWMIEEQIHPKAPLKANDDGPFQRTHVVYQKKELPDRDEFRKLTNSKAYGFQS